MVTVRRDGLLFPPGTAARLAPAKVFWYRKVRITHHCLFPALHPGLDRVLGEVLLASEAPVKRSHVLGTRCGRAGTIDGVHSRGAGNWRPRWRSPGRVRTRYRAAR